MAVIEGPFQRIVEVGWPDLADALMLYLQAFGGASYGQIWDDDNLGFPLPTLSNFNAYKRTWRQVVGGSGTETAFINVPDGRTGAHHGYGLDFNLSAGLPLSTSLGFHRAGPYWKADGTLLDSTDLPALGYALMPRGMTGALAGLGIGALFVTIPSFDRYDFTVTVANAFNASLDIGFSASSTDFSSHSGSADNDVEAVTTALTSSINSGSSIASASKTGTQTIDVSPVTDGVPIPITNLSGCSLTGTPTQVSAGPSLTWALSDEFEIP